MVGSGLTVRTAVGAEMQLQDSMSSHGVALVHTKAMENIVLKRISTILHGPSVQGNPRKETIFLEAFHLNKIMLCTVYVLRVTRPERRALAKTEQRFNRPQCRR